MTTNLKNKKYLAILIMAIVMLVCVIALVACNKDKGDDDTDIGGTELQNYDMSGVSFYGETVTYDGNAHELAVEGTLPTGVTVSYEYYNGATLLESAPVNAGTYRVVAKFTGDSNHNPIEDKHATLTIEKANVEIVLGATTETDNSGDTLLEEPIVFPQNEDGIFTHQVDGHSYVPEVLDSSVEIDNYFFYRSMDDVYSDTKAFAILEPEVGLTFYCLVTLDEEEYGDNYNTSMLLTLTVTQRTVELSTVEDLKSIREELLNDNNIYLRVHTRYALVNDIDMEGEVWETIWTVVPSTASNDGFTGEFDGQGHTISNFVINEYSVAEENLNAYNGMALGFFGYMTDAYIHDVNFSNVNVDLTLSKLEARGYSISYSGTNVWNMFYFGLVAGRIDTSRNGMRTTFENINIENFDAFIDLPKAYVGTFVGQENTLGYRINLDANNVNIYAIETGVDYNQNFYLGGITGDGNTTVQYRDCDLTNITVILGQGRIDSRTLAGVRLGGFAGANITASLVRNCTITNFRLENWATDNVGIYIGTTTSTAGFVNCVASNDNDVDYGVFRCTSNGDDSITRTPVAWN